MMTNVASGKSGPGRIWLIVGLLLFGYALIGNWVALPGYKRFLAHGGPGGGHDGVDLAFVWGAARTIVWMLAFHVGAFCLAVAALSGWEDRRFRRGFMVGGLLWIGLWTIPALPGPYAAFFAAVGAVILALIATVFIRAGREGVAGDERWRIAGYFFLALATWDVCGLGSVGGILNPSGETRSASQTLVVAQTTKLIVEFLLGWALIGVAGFAGRAQRAAS